MIAAAARNLADWHTSSLNALGVSSTYTDQLWCAPLKEMSIYLSAVTLQPRKSARELEEFLKKNRGYPQSVCDSWASLDLRSQGLRIEAEGEWYLRPAAPIAASEVDLEINRVESAEDLLQFEEASIEGFEMSHRGPAFSMHAPGILRDQRMGVFTGRIDGKVVSVAMAYSSASVVGVYGVATLPQFRRRGYGAAMTSRALAFAPGLPAVLDPSPLGAALYRRLGFQSIGHFYRWVGTP